MNRHKFENDGQHSDPAQRTSAKKKGARDADILVLLWDVFKTRANEIDHLLDLSLSILAGADDFPQKAEVEAALKKAIALVRA